MFSFFKRNKKPKRSLAKQPQRQPIFESLETRALLSTVSPTIEFLHSDSTTGSVSGYTPAQIRTAYGFDTITNSSSTAAEGAGQTIAIVDAYSDPSINSDLTVFDTEFGLTTPSLKVVNQTGGSTLPTENAGWDTEISLDVEWAHAIAPEAKILLVEASSDNTTDLLAAVDYARNASGVSVVSMSWGGSEFFDWSDGGESTSETDYDSYFTTPTGHQGVTFVAAAGDDGAQSGVEWPAVSPNVISVGGTSLTVSDSSGTYYSESAWNGTSGGYSQYESEPAYQDAVQSTGARSAPDVSYDGDPNTGFAVYDSVTYEGESGWQEVGGTSAGAPQWAALIAIADELRTLAGKTTLDGATQTLPELYSLYSAPDTSGYSTYTDYFNDITDGGDGDGFHFRWGGGGGPRDGATEGYDTLTGLGSPKADAIATALAGVSTNGSGSGSTSGSTGSGGSTTTDALPASPITITLLTQPTSSAIEGTTGKIEVELTNTSDSNFSGPISITLSLSSDGTVSTDDTSIHTFTIKHGKLAEGASKTFTLRFTYPTATNGNYYLIASLSATDTDTAASDAVSINTIALAAPAVDLATTFAQTQIPVTPGDDATATVVITNDGNVTANGTLGLVLYASTDRVLNSSDQVLKRLAKQTIHLAAGASITLHIKFKAPATLAAGSYSLIADATPITKVADDDSADNIAVIDTVAS